MFRLLAALLILILGHISVSVAGPKGSSGAVAVRGYYKSNGTYVAPHYRSPPDGNSYNNWSTVGNINPYTGAPGTKQPYSGIGRTSSHDANQRPAYAEDLSQLSEPAFERAPTSPSRSSVALPAPTGRQLDSPPLSHHDNELIERACSLTEYDGPAAYNACRNLQLKKLARGPKAPDLAHLSGQEKDLIDRACSLVKYDGPSAYNACTTSQVERLARGPKAPSLSRLSAQERDLIERACSLVKYDGPAAHNACTASQVKQLARGPKLPDLGLLSGEERELIGRACSLAKYDGPAAHNRCVASQVAQLVK